MILKAVLDNKARAYLPIHVLTVGTDFTQNPMKRPKGAPYHHIFYIEKGEGMLETDEGSFALHQGDAVFMRRDVPTYYYGITEEFKTAWVTFAGKGADDILSYYGAPNFAFLKNDDIESRINGTYNLVKKGASPDILSQRAYDIITYFFSVLKQGQMSSLLLSARELIAQRFSENLSVGDIANSLGVSESLIYRVFKEQGDMTPSEYLRYVRIHNAEKMLLSEPKMQISEVAVACGFLDPAYFCKIYKRETGITPKKYQNTYKM